MWPVMEKIIHTNDRVNTVAISPDGSRILSGSYDKTIRLWDAETGNASGAPLLGHTDYVPSVAISPDGSRIVSGSADNTIRVWDAETGKALGGPLLGHTDCVRSVAISPDGSRIVSGSDDNTIQIWDAETGNASGAPLLGHTDCVLSVAISPDGSRIVSGSRDSTIRVWDAETGGALGVPLRCVDWRGNTPSTFLSVTFLRDGNHVVSGSVDNTIRVWDLSEFLDPFQTFGTPVIRFSSNPTHVLRDASSFLSDSHTPMAASLVITEERWVVGPTGCLLLWVPIYFPHVYAPGNTLTIPDTLQLDLSCFAHGTSWHECRE